MKVFVILWLFNYLNYLPRLYFCLSENEGDKHMLQIAMVAVAQGDPYTITAINDAGQDQRKGKLGVLGQY